MNFNLVSIIFSKNRALQLQATLDSFFLNCKDSKEVDIVVFYKTTSKSHFRQYQVLREVFKKVLFIEETRLVKQLVEVAIKYEYVLLQVDDTIFTNPFLLSEVKAALQENNSTLGFSLRLGLNTTYCYNRKRNQRIPKFLLVNNKIVKYRWGEEQLDFAYPLEVSSSVYRTKDVMPIWLENINITVPHVVNRLEEVMNKGRKRFVDSLPYLLCYKQSVAFSNPMNGVSIIPKNWVISIWGDIRFSVDALMKVFDSGNKINVAKLVGFVSNSCHQEVKPEFTK